MGVIRSNIVYDSAKKEMEGLNILYRGSYMSAHVLLNLLNELGGGR